MDSELARRETDMQWEEVPKLMLQLSNCQQTRTQCDAWVVNDHTEQFTAVQYACLACRIDGSRHLAILVQPLRLDSKDCVIERPIRQSDRQKNTGLASHSA